MLRDDAAVCDIPDPSKLYAAARKLSSFLISRAAIVPVTAAALLPLVAAGATQLPVKELLEIARAFSCYDAADAPTRQPRSCRDHRLTRPAWGWEDF